MKRWPFRRKPKVERIDPVSFLRRSEAVTVRMSEVMERANEAEEREDLEALRACSAEAQLLVQNIRDIRLEQLEAEENGYVKLAEEMVE